MMMVIGTIQYIITASQILFVEDQLLCRGHDDVLQPHTGIPIKTLLIKQLLLNTIQAYMGGSPKRGPKNHPMFTIYSTMILGVLYDSLWLEKCFLCCFH